MLCNTTCLTGNNVGFADIVEERSFTVVNVTHDGNDRRTFLHLVGVEFLFKVRLVADVEEFNLKTKFFGKNFNHFGVETRVD